MLRRLALLALVAAACGDRGPPVWAPSPHLDGPPTDACIHARELRARAPKLLDEGRLERAVRVLQRAEDICSAEAPATWTPRVTALAVLGRSAEALQLAGRIERSDRATAADRAAAAAARAIAEEHGRTVIAGGSRRDNPELFDPNEKKRKAASELLLEGARASRAGDAATAKELFLKAWKTWHPNPRALVEAGLAAAALGDHAEAHKLWDRAAYDDASVSIRPELPMGAPRALHGAAVAWAPGGKKLAVGGDEEIAVHDAELRPVLHLRTGQAVTALAFAGGEERLVAALEGGRLRVYDAVLGEAVRDLAGHDSAPRIVACSPDGRTVVSAAQRTLRLWDLASGRAGRVVTMPRSAAAVAWSEDSARVAWADEGGGVAVMEVSTGTATPLARARGAVRAMSLRASDASLTVVTGSERLRYDTSRPREPPRSLARARAGVASCAGGDVAFEAGAHIAVTAFDGVEELAAVSSAERGGVAAFALAPDSSVLLAAYRDRALALLPVRARAAPRVLARPAPLAAFAAAPTGKVLAAATADGRVLVWDVAPVGLRAFAEAGVRAMAISPDGHTIAFGVGRRIEVRDLAAGRPGVALEAAGAVDSLAFAPDGMRLAAGTQAPSVQLFEPGSRSSARSVRLEGGPVRAARFSPDGRSLLIAAKEGVVLWTPATHKASRFVPYGSEPRDVVFAPDGRSMVVADKRGALLIGKPLETSPAPSLSLPVASQVVALAVAPDGTVITGEGDRAVRLRTQAGKVFQRFGDPDGPVRAVTYLPQGLAAAGCGDGVIRLFMPPKAEPVAVLEPAPGLGTGALAGLVRTPSGHLEIIGPDAGAAREVLRCRLEEAVVPFEVCADHFEVEGLLPMVVAGKDPAEAEP